MRRLWRSGVSGFPGVKALENSKTACLTSRPKPNIRVTSRHLAAALVPDRSSRGILPITVKNAAGFSAARRARIARAAPELPKTVFLSNRESLVVTGFSLAQPLDFASNGGW